MRESITKKDLERLHGEFNRSYFGGKLRKPTFKWQNSKLPYGRYVAGSNEIWISRTADKWSEDFLHDVMIHEMIHQYVYERMMGFQYSLVQHGFQFHYVRWRLRRMYGLKISGGPIL